MEKTSESVRVHLDKMAAQRLYHIDFEKLKI